MTSSRQKVFQSSVQDAITAAATGSILSASAAVRRVRGIRRRGLIRRPQSLHEGYQGSYFRGSQILAVCRHVSASLDDLPDQLIVGEARGDGIQRGAAQTTLAPKAMAVPALLALNEDRPLKLQRRATFYICGGRGRAAPGLHVRRPGCEGSEIRQQTGRTKRQHHDHDSHGTATVTLLAGSRIERKQDQDRDADDGRDQKEKGLHVGRQQREDC